MSNPEKPWSVATFERLRPHLTGFVRGNILPLLDDLILSSESPFSKFAIFDYDWTLVKPCDGRRFPKDVADWQYLRLSVPETVRKFAKDHQIVIVTDQSKGWKIDQIKAVLADLEIEATVIVGVKEESQKPSTTLFTSAFPNFKKNGFYVGDAAGRKGDWSDKDRVFAERLGVRFYTPEEMFELDTIQQGPATVSEEKEVVIMVGYPASGKSTIAKSLERYYRVDGDILKTAKAMIKDAEKHVSDASIVFDSTSGTKEKRAQFIEFARSHSLPVRIFWVQTSIEQSMERNKQRAAEGGIKVPDVVFYVYRKKFEPPTEEEGVTLLNI